MAPGTNTAYGQVDFGRTAADYARHRAGFPERFYDRLFAAGFVKAKDRVVDLGTGTGTVARDLAKRGCEVTGLDPSQLLTDQAKNLDREAGVQIRYVLGTAEQTGLAENAFDVVTAGTCWHWFEQPQAAREAKRLLVGDGRIIIASLDWLPLPGNVVEATESLIRAFNPRWDGDDGTGVHPEWFAHLSTAAFRDLESFSFDVLIPYAHEAWLGRIRASSGVGASLAAERIQRFNDVHREILAQRFPEEPLQVPHRVFAVCGRSPG
jgi:SAM-dependent methyltransferase